MSEPQPDDYTVRTYDKLRYGDTDRQGHVNNAAFATLLETGRVEILYAADGPLAAPGCSFVIARLAMDFRAEITWPGTVDICTRVVAVGRSSVRLEQGLFQDGRCAATAESVVVHVHDATRRSHALPPAAVHRLTRLIPGNGGASAAL